MTTDWLEIGASAIHGQGGFASRDIPRGTKVIEYIGERISKAESLRRCEADNPYIFALDDTADVDGNVEWNPARFINHSCSPNCEAQLEQGRIWLVACRDIRAGEEITFNYGFDLEDYKDYPCHCGAENCVGYIVAEEFFAHVRQQRGLAEVRRTKLARNEERYPVEKARGSNKKYTEL